VIRLSRSELVWVPITLIAILLVYLPGLGNPLVFDDEILTESGFLAQYRALELRTRMLSYGSFAWLQAVFGDAWWTQRLLNVLLHAGVVLALWGLYRQILRHIEAAPAEGAERSAPAYHESPALGIAIGFFALNPVAVYAVAYLVQRSIVMATFFVVLGLWLFVRALSEKKPWMHGLALLCYALAVLSKEHAILAPLAAVPLWVLAARPSLKRFAAGAGAGLLVAAAAAGALVLRYGVILGVPFDEYSHVYLAQLSRLSPNASTDAFALSILNEAYLFFEYGLRWFLPYTGWMSINLRPPFPVSFATFPHVLGAFGYLAVLAGGSYLLYRFRDWRALVGVSLLLPAILFATEFSTVWVQDPFVLYRSYLWAIGVPGIVFVLVHGPSVRILAAIALLLGVLLSWQAQDRVFSMRSTEELWTDAIRKLPNDPRAVGRWFPYLNRGATYVESDRLSLAIPDFERSAALGDMGMGAANLGSVLSAKGRHREALAALDRAEKQGYNLYGLPFQRGLALAALGRTEEAYRQFQAAWQMSPPSPAREIVLLHLGRLALQLDKPEEAVLALDGLLDRDPKHREGRYLLAMAHIKAGRHERARQLLDPLVQDDRNSRAYYARALANHGLNRKAEALSDIETAMRLGRPGDPNLREWQARIQAMK
jgi:tetratricopeptide (TPR) repeat protein